MTVDYDRQQSLLKFFNRNMMERRAVHELQALAAAIIYDGKVDENELEFLGKWIVSRGEFRDQWPFRELFNLYYEILEDGVVTKEERMLLFDALCAIAASDEQSGTAQDDIFDDDADIIFPEHSFLFTGVLQIGKRKDAQRTVEDLGGKNAKSPRRDLDYLVVGDLGSDMWTTSRYGTKIKKVMDHKDAGCPTTIVREVRFCRAIAACKEG